MNHNFTDQSITYLIHSSNRKIGGNYMNCDIPMGCHLSNYEYFTCEVISFHGQFMRMMNQYDRVGELHVFDFIEGTYNTNKTEGDSIIPMVSFKQHQYRTTSMNYKFIVKNFDSKTIKFKILSLIDKNYVQDVIFPSESREWSLLLLLTPIQTNKLPYFICEKKYESFSYTISTVGLTQKNDCTITLPSINDGYNRYFVDVQVISALINNTTRQASDDIILLYAYNWADKGFGGLGCDSMLIGTIINRSNSLISIDPKGSHSKFIISNMKSSRNIRFKLFRENLSEFPSNGINEEFEYSVTYLITPIN
jgi:hypothetical protein